MTYKHTHEVDTTYELSQQGAMQLPRSVADGLNLRPNAKNKARVRVTTDEKTGDVLAKIVKTKVADIHVYSPRTLFDWRISVNAEVDFDIDMNDLVAVETRDGKGVRRKDRVSYKHTQYQIDLTQVTPAEVSNENFFYPVRPNFKIAYNSCDSRGPKLRKYTNLRLKSRARRSASTVFWS